MHPGRIKVIRFPLTCSSQLAEPPERLYHGTATRFVASIRAHGLLKGQRQHVHLSLAPATAISVGQRYGRVVVLKVDACGMSKEERHFLPLGEWCVADRSCTREVHQLRRCLPKADPRSRFGSAGVRS